MEISAVRKCFWCLTNKINQINVEHVNGFILLFVCLWELTLKFWSIFFWQYLESTNRLVDTKTYIHTHTHTYILSWPKISAPLQFCQKFNTYLIKLFQLQMFWYSCAYCFCLHCNNTKKQEKKSQTCLINFTQNKKWTGQKMIGTLSKL